MKGGVGGGGDEEGVEGGNCGGVNTENKHES